MYPGAWGLGAGAAPFPSPYSGNGPFGSGSFIGGPGQALPSNTGAGMGQGGYLGAGQLPGSGNFGVAGQQATAPGGFMQGSSGGFTGGGRGMGAAGGNMGAPSPPIPGSLCGGMGAFPGVPGQGGAPRQGGRGRNMDGGAGGGGGMMGGGGGKSGGRGGGRGGRGGKDMGRGRGGKGGDGGKQGGSVGGGPGGCGGGGGAGGGMPFGSGGGKGGGCKPSGGAPFGGKGGCGGGMMGGRGPANISQGGHSNLFVGNLADDVTEETIREIFGKCGTVTSCRVLTRSGRTCALVKMENAQQAEQAVKTIPSMVGGDSKTRWLVKYAETDFGASRGGKDGMFGKGKGFDFFKGKGKFGWGFDFFKGKGMKGKGKGKGPMMLRVDPTLKVWVGSIPEGVDWKALQTHMDQAGKTVWVEVFAGTGKGTGAVVFKTAEDAKKAIEELNGSELNGSAIVVDAWVRQVKEGETADGAAPPSETQQEGATEAAAPEAEGPVGEEL